MYTTAEAARLLTITPGRVCQLAREMGWTRQGRDWLFTDGDIDTLAERNKKAGYPKGRPRQGWQAPTVVEQMRADQFLDFDRKE